MPNLRGMSPVGRDDGEGHSYAAWTVGGEESGVGVEEETTSGGVVVDSSGLDCEYRVETQRPLVLLPRGGAGEGIEFHEGVDAGRRSFIDNKESRQVRRDVTREGHEPETVGKIGTSWPSASANSSRVKRGRETRLTGTRGNAIFWREWGRRSVGK